MWNIKFNWTILILSVLFTSIAGSCLEYGHSCWGAHGKRSWSKTQRIETNLPYRKLHFFNKEAIKEPYLYNTENKESLESKTFLKNFGLRSDAEKPIEPQNILQKESMQPKSIRQEQKFNRLKYDTDESLEKWNDIPLYKYKYKYSVRQLQNGDALEEEPTTDNSINYDLV